MSSCHTPDSAKRLRDHQNKIRKRGCSSSSSSSLVRRKYRFKRAILVGKKGGSSTPVPMWKTRSTSSPSVATHQHAKFPNPLPPPSGVTSEDNEFSVSARKLAATLWEINGIPSSKIREDLEIEQARRHKGIRSREKSVSLSRSDLLRPHMSDPSYSPKSEMNGFKGENLQKRVSNKLQLGDYYTGGFDVLSSPGFKEVQ